MKNHTPWALRVLTGLGAWLAALLTILFLFSSGLIESEEGALTAGMLLLVAALRLSTIPFVSCGIRIDY